MIKRIFSFAALTALLFASGRALSAVDVYSNLGTPDSSSNAAIGYQSVTNFNVWYAQGFTTGSIAFALESVDLPLAVSGAGNGSPLLGLYTDNAGLPGTDLGVTFTNPTFSVQQLYNLSVATPYNLATGTNYWLVLKDSTAATSQTKFNWYYSDAFSSPSGQNSSGFTYLSAARTINNGSSWATNTVFSYTGITVHAVPEPTTYTLGTIATGVLAYLACRRHVSIARAVACD